MAQDHFKTPPDPKKGYGIIKHPLKDKQYSRAGQVMASQKNIISTPEVLSGASWKPWTSLGLQDLVELVPTRRPGAGKLQMFVFTYSPTPGG